MRTVDKIREEVPEPPPGVADAMTCGSIGCMIEQSLKNTMIREGDWRNGGTMPAQVLLYRNDPPLEEPIKPIGPFCTEEEAKALIDQKGWTVKAAAGRVAAFRGGDSGL